MKNIYNKTKRNMNMELLRIISMYMVVILHYLGHGGAVYGTVPMEINYLFTYILKAFCIVAVNCYVLISGYFLLESEFKIKRLFKIWFQVIFYSVGIYFVLVIAKLIPFSFKNVTFSMLPVLMGQYWFVTTYVALYLLFPFLNIAIKSMDKKLMRLLVIVLFCVFSLWTTLIPISTGLDPNRGYSIIWFICLYIFAAYIRLHYDSNKKWSYYFKWYIIVSIFIAISKIVLFIILKRCGIDDKGSGIFYMYNSVPVLVSSIMFFICFIKIEIRNKIITNIIGVVSKLTLGIYLIDDNNSSEKFYMEKYCIQICILIAINTY